MRLLIPTTDTNGASAQLSGHFGRAPFYAIADTETGTMLRRESVRVSHGHGECVPASDVFGEDGYDAVVCQGIGRGAIARLNRPAFRSSCPTGRTSPRPSRPSGVGPCALSASEDGCSGSGSCGEHGHGHDIS